MQMVDANGLKVPAIGLGTWDLRGREAQDIVESALEIGYRHLDTAEMYGNEREVGAGLAASGFQRSDVFVTTKVWPDNLAAGDLQRAAENSLKKLGLDQVDLYLIHWPNPNVPLAESLTALAEVQERGLARRVGVSNFPGALLEEAVNISTVPLALNQVELHPYLAQTAVFEAARRHGMAVTAYCPIARGRVISDPTVVSIAKAHGKTPAQIALRWLTQKGDVVVIPKSAKRQRLEENFSLDFDLTSDEVAAMDGLARHDGRIVDPDFSPAWDA